MAGDLCGKWMPRKQTHCARGAGHAGPCGTPDSMERQRQRGAARRPDRVYDPVAARRWRANHRLARYGLNQETFARLLDSQEGACGMCRESFEERQLIFVDHDHSCCPDEKKSCGQCVRGLLCLRCNTGLGYIERMGGMARAYLDRISAVPAVW